ncbi:FHA domain-containing protein [Nocardioides jiangxiensis]|uniref:FHA domain-containing protein n=1 Tax=Nocardioides jiangxiensis TaxID=3064524 RepID=A0ABT9B0M4_9ACTN|nr:FHA domain-containing protein [Nocardioides sp. WY-20]MDO7868414.1 FHA domain-containing protein [Nocardioides sp. WY-20]
MRVTADLRFSVGTADGRTIDGRVHGDGRRLQLEMADPAAFAGFADAPGVAGIAEALAVRGLVLDVMEGPGRRLLSLGAVHAPWWQRRITGSRRIRLAGWRALRAPSRARLRELAGRVQGKEPTGGLLPPATPFPLAPTFARRVRVRPTGTNDPARGGQPRLVLVRDSYRPGERQPIFWLGEGTCRIGSGADCDIRLPGLRELHAEVVHDANDEFVVMAHAPATYVHGAPAIRAVLRTGARLRVGEWTLAFARAEYADHGRPFAGRVGGELGHQRPQPSQTRWSG